jgi:hypothetical protein
MGGISPPRLAFLRAQSVTEIGLSRLKPEELEDVLHRPRLARCIDPVLHGDMLLASIGSGVVRSRSVRHRLP